MDTQSISQTINEVERAKAQQTSDIVVGVIIVVVALFLIIVFAAVFASIVQQKANKCPKCGNWKRNKSAMQSVQSGDTTTTKKIVVCAKCKHEYPVVR